MSVKVFYSPLLQEVSNHDLRVKQIGKAFKAYKETGELGVLIGRDVDIGRPPAARMHELMHTHLYPTQTKVRGIALKQYNRTSDIFLIYCEGISSPDCYCLIDIIWNDAHSKLNNHAYILDQVAPVAKKFRERF